MAAMVGIGQPLGVEIRGVIHTWYVSDLNLTIVDVVARVPVHVLVQYKVLNLQL